MQSSRKHKRVVLHWPLLLASNTSDPLETRTENLSSAGFYCFSPRQFRAGERLEALIRFPQMFKTHFESSLCLKCAIQVVRVETDPQTGFGVGCRIEDYELVTNHLRFFGSFRPSQRLRTCMDRSAAGAVLADQEGLSYGDRGGRGEPDESA